jgi:hypothetical protein
MIRIFSKKDNINKRIYDILNIFVSITKLSREEIEEMLELSETFNEIKE